MKATFLVGAGFCVDANANLDPGAEPVARPYPLVGDLATHCFPETYDFRAGVEPAFQQAIERRDRASVGRLVELIQAADYFVGTKIAAATSSPYSNLLEQFPTATFLSFNYDSLLEVMLYQRRLWTPVDGFGVECDAEVNRSYVAAEPPPPASKITVLHLHGSVYLYPLEFQTYAVPGDDTVWLRDPSSCRYRFDPDALGNLFIPFRSGVTGLTYKHIDERVIAPVPDKATVLSDRFVEEIYRRATSHLRSVETLISIGYRFADCDRSSFDPLLLALGTTPGRTLAIISPEAAGIAAELQPQYPGLDVVPYPSGFAGWVEGARPTHPERDSEPAIGVGEPGEVNRSR